MNVLGPRGVDDLWSFETRAEVGGATASSTRGPRLSMRLHAKQNFHHSIPGAQQSFANDVSVSDMFSVIMNMLHINT